MLIIPVVDDWRTIQQWPLLFMNPTLPFLPKNTENVVRTSIPLCYQILTVLTCFKIIFRFHCFALWLWNALYKLQVLFWGRLLLVCLGYDEHSSCLIKLNQNVSYMENISINFCWTHAYVFVCRPPGSPEIYIYNEYSTERSAIFCSRAFHLLCLNKDFYSHRCIYF